MGGLVAYESSDDDEDIQDAPAAATNSEARCSYISPMKSDSVSNPSALSHSQPAPAPAPGPQLLPPAQSTPIGPGQPILGPSLPPTGMDMNEASITDDDQQQPTSSPAPPLSPYTAERNLVRDLTLPTVPNMDLPPSPPRSPPPAVDGKFRHFLEIKKQGQHFNERLASSAGARNPSMADKLIAFAGVGCLDSRDGLKAQYRTSLALDLVDPEAFPDSAFRRELKRSRDMISKEREAERASGQRGIEFVPATTAGRAGATY
ncbi:hypothetical protein MKZ38_005005 [Zalerion maritima]|uniref:Uncharacterized protein n=1 Tax=Zalerion maritima TaxID=339359 RepID=A0AAD5RLP3_9PEZI|nr:hypothetical protein MKZ38_005005 [Zalerion maritima]